MSLVLDRHGIAGRSEDESHGQAPFPQHRIQTEDCPVAGETLHGLAKRHDISRNLIRISGYYEWQNTPRNSRGTFNARDGSSLLTAAGLWDEWNHRETGERLKFCAMIVGEPNELAAEIHERMPVFLMEDQFAAWLSGAAGAEYLKPAPNDYLQRWPVSKQVIARRQM